MNNMKNVMITTLLFLVSSVDLRVSAQSMDWQKTTDWRVYNIHRSGSLQYPVDSLKQFNSFPLSQDSMHFFLQKMTAWPKEKTTVWMGAFIASCKLENELRKIDISNYGGFIFDESAKQYFELPERYRSDWLEFLNHALDQMRNKSRND